MEINKFGYLKAESVVDRKNVYINLNHITSLFDHNDHLRIWVVGDYRYRYDVVGSTEEYFQLLEEHSKSSEEVNEYLSKRREIKEESNCFDVFKD